MCGGGSPPPPAWGAAIEEVREEREDLWERWEPEREEGEEGGVCHPTLSPVPGSWMLSSTWGRVGS